jgi:hypothetical protein
MLWLPRRTADVRSRLTLHATVIRGEGFGPRPACANLALDAPKSKISCPALAGFQSGRGAAEPLRTGARRDDHGEA